MAYKLLFSNSTPNKEPESWPKKSEQRSQAIRDHFKAESQGHDPGSSRCLGEHGITVTPTLSHRQVQAQQDSARAAKKAAKSGDKRGQETRSQQVPGGAVTTSRRTRRPSPNEVVDASAKRHHGHGQLRRHHQGQEQAAAAGGEGRSSRMSLPKAASSASPKSRRPLPSSRPQAARHWQSRPCGGFGDEKVV